MSVRVNVSLRCICVEVRSHALALDGKYSDSQLFSLENTWGPAAATRVMMAYLKRVV